MADYNGLYEVVQKELKTTLLSSYMDPVIADRISVAILKSDWLQDTLVGYGNLLIERLKEEGEFRD